MGSNIKHPEIRCSYKKLIQQQFDKKRKGRRKSYKVVGSQMSKHFGVVIGKQGKLFCRW